MNQAEASRQIQQMVEFIKQEAKEKAEEIRVKTDQEYNIAKLSLIESTKQQIFNEFDQLRKEKVNNQKIARSTAIQNARRDRLQHQQNLVESLRAATLERLKTASQQPAYEDLIVALIVQGLIRLREDRVKIRCRSEDAAIVMKCLDAAKAKYQQVVTRDLGQEHDCQLDLDTTVNLPSSVCGGVELLAQNDKICVSNTLSSRLSLCFDDFKPVLRATLFDEA